MSEKKNTTAMNILVFDTALNKTYIALQKAKVVDECVIETDEKNYHSAYLISSIKNIMQKNDLKLQELDLVVVNNGPGSFTGIRVGVTVAKTLSKELGVNVLGVSSLDILQKAYEYSAPGGEISCTENPAKPDVILDARKELFYFKGGKNALNCSLNSDSKDNIDLVPYSKIQNHITQNTVVCDSSSFLRLEEYMKIYPDVRFINFEEDNINLGLSLLNIAKDTIHDGAKSLENIIDKDFSWYTLKPRYIQPPPIHKK